MTLADNRKDVRHAFASLVTVALPYAIVFNGEVADFGGQTPAIVISGGGSDHQPLAVGEFTPVHTLSVFLFVLYKNSETGWDEFMAEDQLDDMEHDVFGVVKANQKTSYWDGISYPQPSQPNPFSVGGLEYKREVITLNFS